MIEQKIKNRMTARARELLEAKARSPRIYWCCLWSFCLFNFFRVTPKKFDREVCAVAVGRFDFNTTMEA